MSKTNNQKTIDTYKSKFNEYVQGTTKAVSGDAKKWIDDSLEGLDHSTTILELGSGFGRDADYISSCGYAVNCSDVVEEFVRLLQGQDKDAILLNAIADDIPNGFDLIIANAVLLHFTRDETRKVCKKIYEALNARGRFALRLKKGDGEEWLKVKIGGDRYFCYWQPEDIEKVLKKAGFSKVVINIGEKTRYSQAGWLGIVAYK